MNWIKIHSQLFFTAFLQVMFVVMTQVFVTRELIIPIVFTSFMINIIWTWNVKKVAFGGWSDRFTYAFGATTGTMFGYYLAHFISKLL